MTITAGQFRTLLEPGLVQGLLWPYHCTRCNVYCVSKEEYEGEHHPLQCAVRKVLAE